jgi:catecholate siderophore receptor
MISSGGVPGDEVISNKGWGVAPSLELGLGKPTQLLISYLRSGQDNIPAYGIENFNAVPTFDTRKFYGLRSLDFERVATNQLTLRVDHDFSSSMHLRNQFTRGHSESDRIVTSVNPVATKPDSGRRSSKTHINGNDDLTNQTNLSIAFATGGISHDVATGVEISRENSLYGRYTINGTAPAIANLANPTADADYHPTLTLQPARVVRATSLGAYAFETMKIGSKLELNGGLRWDRYTPVYVDSLSRASGFEAKQASALTGRAAVVVKPTEYGSVYVSYGTSFNPSNQNLSADALDKNSALPPEKNISYEIGSKWDLFKERLSATMALFRTDKTNARTTDPADPTTTTILAGKQRVQGGEVGVTGNITPKWNVLAGYSRLNSKVLESLNPAQLNTSLLNVPKHSVTTWTSYQVTRDLEIGGGARYLDKRLLRINGATSIYVPSYHTYDATASYRFNPSIDLRLNLYNLTDKLYYDSGRMWVPAAGRSVAVTTSVKL